MSTTADKVKKEDKMDVASLLIMVDDKEISGEYHVTSVTIKQEINKIPTASLVIIDGEASKEDFPVSSGGEFVPGKKIEISLDYFTNEEPDDKKFVFKGIIVTNSHKINNNCCELNIECKDETVKMTVNRSNAVFDKDMTAADVASQLLEKHNITNHNIDPVSLKNKQLMQSNISDWDFMISRIDVAGMICVINQDGVRIKELDADNFPNNESGEMLELVHGKNIFEFNADKDSRIRSGEVKTLSWDFTKQEVRTTTNDQNAVQDDESKGKNVSDSYEIRSSAYFTEEEQDAISKIRKIKQDLSGVKGTVKFLGRVDIQVQPGDFVNISGVGTTFNGHHFVSAVQQEYADGGWFTEATLGWNEQFFSEQTNPQHAASATGQSSSMQGLQIGIVTNIEDSDGEYRVKVKLPVVDNSQEGLYARVATLDAGDKRGTFFRPEIDDEVILGFVNDDPSNPVILGMLHSSAKAAPLEPEKNNHQKGYVSRSEIKLIFDDDKKSVTIETPGSRVFEMDDDAGTITIKDGDGNKIVMEQSGISIEASQEIKIKAGTSLSLEAMNISIKADTSLEAKGGASAKFEGSGMAEIKGGLVKIN
jgi:Rhs element Vgr protein